MFECRVSCLEKEMKMKKKINLQTAIRNSTLYRTFDEYKEYPTNICLPLMSAVHFLP